MVDKEEDARIVTETEQSLKDRSKQKKNGWECFAMLPS